MENKKIILLIISILAISINLFGCSKDKGVDKNNKSQNVVEDNGTASKNTISKEEYKEIIVSSYEKYIRNMDISDYDDLKNILNDENKKDNNKFVSDLKTILNDSKNNIASFRDSIIGIEVDDKELNDLNQQLVKESDLLIEEIDKRSTELGKLDKNILDKSLQDLIDYIETKLDDDKFDINNFDDTLDKIESKLGINLD